VSLTPADPLKLTLPKGRIQDKVIHLLNRCGLIFNTPPRSYRPICNDPAIETKILKPQNIPSLVGLGRHDCGFAGHDWILEQGVENDVIELLDLGFDPVKIVAAMPEALHNQADWQSKPIVLASEYQKLATAYIAQKGLNAVFVKTYGATEALPPEDADMIIDNTATGSTLRLNRLTIVDELLQSTTRFICNRKLWEDPTQAHKRHQLETLLMLMKSVLNADQRVLLEMNVGKADLEALVEHLPAMRAPTVAPLYNQDGYAVKIAVLAKEVAPLLPKLLAAGAKDILEYKLEKLVTG
jgi:ATP phosphoribosyltransferase